MGTRDSGSVVDARAAMVNALDHGFTVGDGVFETLKVVDGVPFALTRHLARLQRSADAMHLARPNPDVIRAAVQSVLEENDPEPIGRLRITYTAGIAPLSSDRGESVPTMTVAMAKASSWPATTSVVTVPWTRNERSAIAGVKSTAYAENVVALRYAHERGASEAVLSNNRGELCEGTGTNVFVVMGGRVLTPELSSGCLAGVTRELVLEWCDASEETLPYSAMFEADEVFVVSSTRDVHPVGSIDDRRISAPGPATAEVMAQFAAQSAVDQDP